MLLFSCLKVTMQPRKANGMNTTERHYQTLVRVGCLLKTNPMKRMKNRNGSPSLLLHLELVNSKLLFFLLIDNISTSVIHLMSLKRVTNIRDKDCLKTYLVVLFHNSRGNHRKANSLSYQIVTPSFIFQSCPYFFVLNWTFYIIFFFTMCVLWGEHLVTDS